MTFIYIVVIHLCGYKMRYIIIRESARPFLRIPRKDPCRKTDSHRARRKTRGVVFFHRGVYIILLYLDIRAVHARPREIVNLRLPRMGIDNLNYDCEKTQYSTHRCSVVYTQWLHIAYLFITFNMMMARNDLFLYVHGVCQCCEICVYRKR